MDFDGWSVWWWEMLLVVGPPRGWCGMFRTNMVFESSSIEKPTDTSRTSKKRPSSCGGMKTIHFKYLRSYASTNDVQIQPERCNRKMMPQPRRGNIGASSNFTKSNCDTLHHYHIFTNTYLKHIPFNILNPSKRPCLPLAEPAQRTLCNALALLSRLRNVVLQRR